MIIRSETSFYALENAGNLSLRDQKSKVGGESQNRIRLFGFILFNKFKATIIVCHKVYEHIIIYDT